MRLGAARPSREQGLVCLPVPSCSRRRRGAPTTQTPETALPLGEKEKERGTAAKGHQGSESTAETGQGLGKSVVQGPASLSRAGKASHLL